MSVGARLMVTALGQLEAGTLALTPQPAEGVIYAKKIDKAETRIDWSLAAADVHNHIRGLSPFPGAWCEMRLGGRTERLKILRTALAEGAGSAVVGSLGAVIDGRLAVACGTGAVRLTELQRAGGRPAAAEEFLRGTRLEEGMTLS
jgi:methionyl-tRNA formyltransferase